MPKKGPGKAHREGISLIDLAEMFPDEKTATTWFESHVWPKGRHCPRCGSTETAETPSNTMPYWCPSCRSRFSVRTGTAMERSKVPLRKWAFAIYLEMTSLKGVSSMKLHRDLRVTQKTAWFMLHRIREAWTDARIEDMVGPVEVDETYVGGARKNYSNAKRAATHPAHWRDHRSVVAGALDRSTNRIAASVVEGTDYDTLQSFVAKHAGDGAKVYTDEHQSYGRMPFDHHTVRHNDSEYVRGDVHTQGIESFWATLKRAHKGTYHKISQKHMDRYVRQFAGKHNLRNENTVAQLILVALGLVGKRLMYSELVADNGLSNAGR